MSESIKRRTCSAEHCETDNYPTFCIERFTVGFARAPANYLPNPAGPLLTVSWWEVRIHIAPAQLEHRLLSCGRTCGHTWRRTILGFPHSIGHQRVSTWELYPFPFTQLLVFRRSSAASALAGALRSASWLRYRIWVTRKPAEAPSEKMPITARGSMLHF